MRPVLVFDLDDTLYAERQYVLSGFRAVGEWVLRHRGVELFFETSTELFESGVRGNTFELTLRKLGQPADSQRVRELVDVYRNHRPQIELLPDARWALGHFSGVSKLGLLTDGYLTTQRQKVAALGVERFFESILFTDELGREHWKPSPRPYEELASRLGSTHGECVYVADNPTKDFVTARKLGWWTVRIHRAEGEYSRVAFDPDHAAHVSITTLRDLPAALEEGRLG